MSTTLVQETALNAHDRCDRCGAQAFVRVTLHSGSSLLFCAHHGRKYVPAMADVAAHIQDESDVDGFGPLL